MPALHIVVDKREDFRWPDPGERVVKADTYLATAAADSQGRIINLCRDYSYLSAGYYVSLLADARGDRALPDVRAFSEMEQREFRAEHAAALDQLLGLVPKMPRSVRAFSVHVYFGEAEDECFKELAQQAFARLRCPLLRIDLQRAKPWRVAAVHALDPRDVPEEHDEFFLRCLDTYVQRRWQKPRSAVTTRFDLAVLREPGDPLPPSKPHTLQRLIEIGRQMDVDVTLIDRRDYSRLAQFDALFIRETTAVPNHTYRFARKAEREGLPVIDDPASIVRCTNKVFLAELLRGNGVPTPPTRFVTRHNTAALEAERNFPVVVKIPDGSFSIGVERARNPAELRDIARGMLKRSEIILLQDFVQTEFDWRIGVLDGAPLFAARYFMCDRHWQILKHAADGSHTEGPTRAVPVEEVPPAVLDAALRAARLVGRGFYGVDLKQTTSAVYVMEVNDNPNLDAGMEDTALGDELYRRLLRHFIRRAEEIRSKGPREEQPERAQRYTLRAVAESC
jgi:glutathione synthase/RimK-type ligase-like ATP-grasp enzyme